MINIAFLAKLFTIIIKGRSTMDFTEAAKVHRDWNTKLRLYINGSGEIDYKVVQKDNLCELGKWIYNEGQQYSSLKEYQDLKSTHADFHKTAAEIVKLVDNGKIDEAKTNLEAGQKFRKLSMEIVGLLASIEKKAMAA
jgi:chemoreceptor zinc-binding protein